MQKQTQQLHKKMQ